MSLRFKKMSDIFAPSKPKKIKTIENDEATLQEACNDWMESTYPELTELFYFHAFQGMAFPGRYKFQIISQAKKLGGLKRNILDFQFNKNNGVYSSLFIELKIKSPFLKDGVTLLNDYDSKTGRSHLRDQQNTINLLLIEGHYACFAWSFDMFKSIVKNYMEGKKFS